jgi:hypothetical protein
MKALIVIAVILAVWMLARSLVGRYQEAERSTQQSQTESVSAHPASKLSGLPESLEPALANAQQQGAAGMRTFLLTHSRSIRDPRLAEIELDYVVLLSRTDPVEAKRVFDSIKARTLTSSPVYERIRKLEPTFR